MSTKTDSREEKTRQITAVTSGGSDFVLRITWDDGSVSNVDLTEPVFRLKHFRPLRKRKRFQNVHVADWGWSISWGDDLDFSAEALSRLAEEQATIETTPGEFRAWLARHGLTQQQAADLLGVSKRTIAYYSTGAQPIPRTVTLAMKGAEQKLNSDLGEDHSPSTSREPEFPVGTFVRRRSSPDAAGIVTEAFWDEQTETWHFRVLFGNAIRGVPEKDLERVPDSVDPWSDVGQGSFAGAVAFQELLTFERLRKPPSRIAASFGSAKAVFYPYQFKPLLKFLENPSQRILIADDVGLGKTVEAGYILRELRARHDLDRVLIVVPARLRTKWREELRRRFDENFEIADIADFRRLRRRLENDREPEPFRWIVSIESARDPSVIDIFQNYQPAIDLVVVDEAHRMRNRSTHQHRLGQALSACSDAMVFLTATPVQTAIDNLFWLLHILDPEEFSNASTFEQLLEANRPVIRCMNAIRTRPPDIPRAVESLSALRSNPYTAELTSGQFFKSLESRVHSLDSLSRDELVSLQRDLSELSLTGHVISRTRKAEVFPDRPQRRAIVCQIHFTAEEKQFYESVAGLCRMISPESHGWGFAMSVLMAYRYTASCIPAAAELFRERLGIAADPLSFDPLAETEDENGWISAVNNGYSTEAKKTDGNIGAELSWIVRSLTPDKNVDSKFDTFLRALFEVWSDDDTAKRPHRKVVVFSFFKRTLRYLAERLREQSIEHVLIDGDVPIDEREARIDEFANSEDIGVLLSSEVGSEGLDLQFAAVVFNYDLPWNPMVVEQRIGRLDRIGQASPSITIMNLAAEDTIEENILLRLYERIGIFKDTIGELDPILGGKIEDLTLDALRAELTPHEQQLRADEAADAVLDQEKEAQRLTTQADALLAADQGFLDEVDALVGRRRVPAPQELHVFLSNFLDRRYHGSRVPKKALKDVAECVVSPLLGQDLRQSIHSDPTASRVARMLDRGAFLATFDQDAALRHARAELIHSRHPLVKFAYDETRNSHLHRAFLLRLHTEDGSNHDIHSMVKPGCYIFSIFLFDLSGVRPRTEIAPIFVPFGDSSEEPTEIMGEAGERLLLSLLQYSKDLAKVPRIEEPSISKLKEAVHAAVNRRRLDIQERERDLNEARLERQALTLRTMHDARIRAAKDRLETLQDKSAADFAIRMATSKLQKAERDLQSAIEDLSRWKDFNVESEEIAVGFLLVE